MICRCKRCRKLMLGFGGNCSNCKEILDELDRIKLNTVITSTPRPIVTPNLYHQPTSTKKKVEDDNFRRAELTRREDGLTDVVLIIDPSDYSEPTRHAHCDSGHSSHHDTSHHSYGGGDSDGGGSSSSWGDSGSSDSSSSSSDSGGGSFGD